MGILDRETSSGLLPGDIVEIRPWAEIIATLDENGMLDGLPFMPEMMRYCGRRFMVHRRLERTCEDAHGGMRRIRDVVFLQSVRCDGALHGGCQKGCFVFWKEAWLRRVDNLTMGPRSTWEDSPSYPYKYRLEDGQYLCQSTELIHATSYLSPFDFGSYIRDVTAKTYSLGKLLRSICYALFLRLRWRLTGRSYCRVRGHQLKTPKEVLELQPGELVRVKSKEEIVATLDSNGNNRGLTFTVGMIPFCGRTFRVLTRVDKMVNDSTRKLISVQGTVVLDSVTCAGSHILRGGCPRENYYLWREIWLQRVAL